MIVYFVVIDCWDGSYKFGVGRGAQVLISGVTHSFWLFQGEIRRAVVAILRLDVHGMFPFALPPWLRNSFQVMKMGAGAYPNIMQTCGGEFK